MNFLINFADLIGIYFNWEKDYGTFANVILIINIVVTIVLITSYVWQVFHALTGFCSRRRVYPEAKKQHKFCYMICAHDEEDVIGNLIDSIYTQDYPRELMQVFVCADNCHDKTAEIARNRGAIVFERFSDTEKGKSFALDYSIKRIVKEYRKEHYEAMFVFDADNLLAKDYTAEMNRFFEKGFKVATSYRESKNFGTNWVSAGTSMFFARECNLIHKGRMLIGSGTYVSGTGFYVSMDLVERMNGWNYHTLIEDVEFSIDCAFKGIKIGYDENAIFYDEQPTSFKDSVTQRLRWCKGMHQCFYKYYMKPSGLIQCFRTKPSMIKFEMHGHLCETFLCAMLWNLFFVIAWVFLYFFEPKVEFWDMIVKGVFPFIWTVLTLVVTATIQALMVTIKKHKQINAPLGKQIWWCFTFPVAALMFLPLMFVAWFRPVKWKKINHTVSVSIDELNASKEALDDNNVVEAEAVDNKVSETEVKAQETIQEESK